MKYNILHYIIITIIIIIIRKLIIIKRSSYKFINVNNIDIKYKNNYILYNIYYYLKI